MKTKSHTKIYGMQLKQCLEGHLYRQRPMLKSSQIMIKPIYLKLGKGTSKLIVKQEEGGNKKDWSRNKIENDTVGKVMKPKVSFSKRSIKLARL